MTPQRRAAWEVAYKDAGGRPAQRRTIATLFLMSKIWEKEEDMSKQDMPRFGARLFSSLALIGLGASIANGLVRGIVPAFLVAAVFIVLEKTLFAKR